MKRSVYHIVVVAGLTAWLGAVPSAWSASSDANDAPLRVLALTVRAEAAKAEACLTLSAPADVSDRAALAADLSFKKNGRTQTIDPRDLSLTPDEICIQQLDHGADYDLKLSHLQGRNGKKLAQSFSASFTPPDRKASLGFLGAIPHAAFPRLTREGGKKDAPGAFKPPLLRSVNVPTTRLTLYRLSDPKTFVGAWQPFVQGALSPAEGLYYARTHGQSVFETDLVFGDKPNEEQIFSAPLPPDAALTPGLYFLAAEPRGKGEKDPGLYAGKWFRVSNLDVAVAHPPEGYEIFVVDTQAKTPAQGATVQLLARDGAVLAEGTTSAKGDVLLKIEKSDVVPTFVLARTKTGDMDLADLSRLADSVMTPPTFRAFLHTDREVYAPGATATVSLRAENERGESLKIEKSTLKLMRPDRRIYSDQPVVPVDGYAVVNISLPISEHTDPWSLVWTRENGSVLAEMPILLQGPGFDAKAKTASSRAAQAQKDASFPPTQEGWSIKLNPLPSVMREPGVTQARFEVEALDDAGGAHKAQGLYYVVIEEGRSFKWFPAEGRWDYKPLPQLRRIGGGRVTFLGDEATTINFSAPPGHYALHIMNGAGVVLAQQDFTVGIPTASTPEPRDDTVLKPVAIPDVLRMKKPAALTFHVDEPGFLTVIAADGRIRQVITRYVQSGNQTINLAPTEAWNRDVTVRVQWRGANEENALWQKTMPVVDPARELKIDAGLQASQTLTAGAGLSIPLHVTQLEKGLPSFASVVVAPLADRDQTDLAVVRIDRLPLTVDGRGTAKLNLPSFDGKARVTIAAWNAKQYGSSTLTLPARRAFAIDGDMPERLARGERVDLRVKLENRSLPAGSYAYKLHLPEGLKASLTEGEAHLAKSGFVRLNFSLSADARTDGDVQMDITGPQGFKQTQAWPVFVPPANTDGLTARATVLDNGKKLRWPSGDSKDGVDGYWALVSPVAFVSPGSAMQMLAYGTPETTSDMARWLEASRLWGKALVDGKLMSSSRLERARQIHLTKLLLRQNEDGGFPARQSGGASDIQSTAEAVDALQGQAEQAAAQAATWLAQRLQNTWFDESERNARAMAFAALVKIGKADLSSLRYFAETSRDKNLTPEASAALAFALAGRAEDEALARTWLERTGPADTPLSWRALAYLAEDSALPLDQWSRRAALNEASMAHPDLMSATQSLVAMGLAQARAGSWRVRINGGDVKAFDVMTLRQSTRATTLEIENVSGRPLILTEIVKQNKAPVSSKGRKQAR